MSELLHGEITHDIIGAFYDTYNALGWGYPESIYANAMPIALSKRGMSFEREVSLRVVLEGVVLGEFRADLVIAGKVIVELKACERIIAAHEAQLISYLKASNCHIGLLLNFGPKAELRRIIWTDDFRVLKDR
ncbi:GxxExxY protein [Gemmatimonas groenlandica]|uniref:GxxExxY protein n=1 Tax=Gemmatimonas groenlandica TaxID=2732249 RepID=A0A6M4ITA9_9BACT|nr:GxxExxY protein [Gemmatimonas groenlandica]QJR36716.1 GxxExxY protein [Gemmatimonas groenlandica]